jgi:putative ABC transport system permease protein
VLDAVTTVGPVPGIAVGMPSVLVDAAHADAITAADLEPRTALVRLRDPEAGGRVAATARDLLGDTVVVTDPGTATRDILTAPATVGITTAAGAATAAAGLLCVMVVAIMLVLAAPDRDRLLTLLRALGLRRREARGIVAWEVGPWAAVALVVGGTLGLLVPALLRAAVDLTPLTGGERQPALTLDPVLAAAGVAGFAAVLATQPPCACGWASDCRSS